MTINIKNFLNDKSKLSKMGEFQSLKKIEGLEMSSISADLYGDGRDDLALFYFNKGANYATLTTSNSITSEFIPWNNNSHKKIIKGLLVNTKNANTFTGKQGKESIDILAKNLSRILTIKESKSQKGTSETVKIKDLIFASTGVIGEEFPVDQIKDRLPELVEKLRSDQNKMYWLKIASAIMTTDTKPKVAYEELIVGDELIKISAIAKGSGMIAPNLATMLSFIFTNADINSNLLKTLLKRAVANSFNAITVDSDQSTNDMVSIFSTSFVPDVPRICRNSENVAGSSAYKSSRRFPEDGAYVKAPVICEDPHTECTAHAPSPRVCNAWNSVPKAFLNIGSNSVSLSDKSFP